MRILITAGPTREYLDPVRFLSNGSTGQMGYACADAAAQRGHKVTLVSGPVNLEKPANVKLIKVVSAEQMAKKTLLEFDRCHCLIMAAAVSDYTPRLREFYKIRKTATSLSIDFIRTIDILREAGLNKSDQKIIGFALQDKAPKRNAQKKLTNKNLDAIVLDTPEAMGASCSDFYILRRGQNWQSYIKKTKIFIAQKIIELAETLMID